MSLVGVGGLYQDGPHLGAGEPAGGTFVHKIGRVQISARLSIVPTPSTPLGVASHDLSRVANCCQFDRVLLMLGDIADGEKGRSGRVLGAAS